MTERSSEGLDPRRRRLLFRAWRRGVRETDLIVGRFADAYIDKFDDAALDDFERLIEVPNAALYAWVVGAEDAPRGIQHHGAPPAHQLPHAEREAGGERAGIRAGSLAGAAPRAGPAAVAGGRGRRRRGLGHCRPRPRRCGRRQAARDQRRGDLPRRPAHGDAVARARLLRAGHRSVGVSGLGLSALRPGLAARRRGGAAHDATLARLARVKGPRAPVRSAHHRQRHPAARARARDGGAASRWSPRPATFCP